jgi:hypothetical protein
MKARYARDDIGCRTSTQAGERPEPGQSTVSELLREHPQPIRFWPWVHDGKSYNWCRKGSTNEIVMFSRAIKRPARRVSFVRAAAAPAPRVLTQPQGRALKGIQL